MFARSSSLVTNSVNLKTLILKFSAYPSSLNVTRMSANGISDASHEISFSRLLFVIIILVKDRSNAQSFADIIRLFFILKITYRNDLKTTIYNYVIELTLAEYFNVFLVILNEIPLMTVL